MRVIQARNVNDAFTQGLELIKEQGERLDSRNGPVLVMPTPVTTVYERPTERVLFYTSRDANPYFHLMEALWMLAGRNDATWLDQFVKDFSSRYAEADGKMHGAYGFRWKFHFDVDGGGEEQRLPDQLEMIIHLLSKDPNDRRIVLTMWDPVADLAINKKDVPCNTQAYFRVREEKGEPEPYGGMPLVRKVLDITVCCRSNDLIWGAYGANAVHFSVLQEYIAARLRIGVGRYYQISNNYHAYVSALDKIEPTIGTKESLAGAQDLYIARDAHSVLLADHPEHFNFDLRLFMSGTPAESGIYENSFFPSVAVPLKNSYAFWRDKKKSEALSELARMPIYCDWRVAAERWLTRRMGKV